MMSEQEFEAQWQHNQEQRRAESAAVVGKWDQADALLLVKSGWTQERIAAKVKRSRESVDKLLRFGRFIDWYGRTNSRPDAPTASIPSTLAEWRFRKAWSKSPKKGSEAERFEAAREILEAAFAIDPLGLVPWGKKTQIPKLLTDTFQGKDWFTFEEAMADLEGQGATEENLKDAISRVRAENRNGCMLEEKRVKGRDLMRIRKLPGQPKIKAERVIHFYEEAMPLLKEAKNLADRNVAIVSPQAILHKLVLIERLIKGLYGEASEE